MLVRVSLFWVVANSVLPADSSIVEGGELNNSQCGRERTGWDSYSEELSVEPGSSRLGLHGKVSISGRGFYAMSSPARLEIGSGKPASTKLMTAPRQVGFKSKQITD